MTNKYKCTQEDFDRDIENHEMVIEHDDGLFRSIYYGRPKSGTYHFRVTTWKGHLAISGDMGCFVFSRLADMFDFFRTDHGINPSYWAEKIQASDDSDGVMSFSADKLADDIRDNIKCYYEDEPEKKEGLEDLIHDVSSAYNEHEAIQLIYDSELGNTDYLSDLSRYCYSEYTYRYIWCLRAIVWAIKQYDESKQCQ